MTIYLVEGIWHSRFRRNDGRTFGGGRARREGRQAGRPHHRHHPLVLSPSVRPRSAYPSGGRLYLGSEVEEEKKELDMNLHFEGARKKPNLRPTEFQRGREAE